MEEWTMFHFSTHRTKTKKKKRISSLLWVFMASFITATFLFYYHDDRETEESLTYFPDDPTLTFSTHQTTLTYEKEVPYGIHWSVQSKINHPTYLRQDVSLLY